MFNQQTFRIVLTVALVTAAIRFVPFLVFNGKRKTPELVIYLAGVLPCAIMGMLVVFCLKNVSLVKAPHGIPELLGCLVTAGLYVWRKNTLLSVVGGTAVYMLLVQAVF